jgi:CheY-like chemotaxis protein
MGMIVPGELRDILLVEDDPADALLISDALLQPGTGRTVTHVEDGIAALERLRESAHSRPDLIVLDLNMPRMNGRELLAILKDDEKLKVIPVVVMSTSDAPDDVVKSYQSHANAYITKPLNLDEFIRAVQSIDAFFLGTATRIPDSDEA